MALAKTIVIKSNMSCNLRCNYCYEFNRNETKYNNISMKADQLCEFIKKTAILFPESRILWMLHGGEPLINGIEYFQEFVDCVRFVNSKYGVEHRIALQTNATLLSDNWIKTLEQNADLLSERIVSVSIDGPQHINDKARITRSGKSSYQMVSDSIKRIKNSNLSFTTITVIGAHNVNNPEELYGFIRELEPDLCKFIPCYNHTKQGKPEKLGINPAQYALFMCKIFDLWLHDLPEHDNWFMIEPITTIICKLTNTFVTWCEYRKDKCENFCCLYPDGELWLCDSYDHNMMRDYAYLGNINQINDEELSNALLHPKNICKYEQLYNSLIEKCNHCSISNYCCSGCLPYRQEILKCSESLFNEYCTAKQQLINYIKEGVLLALSKSEDDL